MHSPFRKRGVILASLLALALAAALPSPAMAKPEPGAKKATGFRLFARPLGAMTINRIYCGLSSDGQICVDSTNSSTIGGGFWPKGTADQYIFNTGLQLAGVVGADGGPWAGDTTGAFFFDPKGTTQHGTQVEPIYNTANPADFQDLPEAGYVPFGDASADLFSPLLTGTAASRREQASQGDVWWMSWDGDPALNAGRSHPLGIVVETRGMGWNFPTGNEDIIYFIYTFYNVTTTNAADYVNIRPEMQSILLDKAQEFQAKNNATFGVTLPTGGYTIDNLFAAFGTDMDVASAGTNYSSVNLPFALGYTYVQSFAGEVSWTFDPSTFAPPFMPGAGFAGIKYLKSPDGPGAIQLFSNTVNGSPFPGAFNDPQNATQLWRYLSGNISVPAGDQPCNTGDPAVSRICWINNTQPADMRFFQSSSGFSLPPGGQGSIVVAYIFAAPVAVPGGCPAPGAACGSGNVKPGNPTILGNPTLMAGGVNLVDSISGFISATDLDGSGTYEQAGALGPEWTVVPGSLLGKSYTAQAVFDAKFLLPFAPTAPAFFLIPGNNQVTVMWQPSPSEVQGDPYYSVASDVASALYDPNYREYDVEGYRVYRGRTDNPDDLSLVAQFDYAGTIFNDYDGVVNPVDTCAPELNIFTDCPVAYDPVAPGVPRTVANENNIVSPFIMTKFGDRLELATGNAILTGVDTVVTGNGSGYPELTNTGVPFVFVDNGVRNNFRYFYVVTAFDVNSWASGPTSLESPKSGTISVTPQAPASNYQNTANLSSGIYGRDVELNASAPWPTLDPATGRFSGPMPPANAWTVGFENFVQSVISAPGNFAVRLDSISLGDSYNGIPVQYFMSAINGANVTPLTISLEQVSTQGTVTGAAAFDAVQIDGSLASIYGGNSNYSLKGQATMQLYGTYHTGGWGRGCVNSATGFGSSRECAYNGPRWFAGPSPQNNETMANPNSGNPANFTTQTMDVTQPNNTGWNNAGELPGVVVIHTPASYETIQTTFRTWEGILSGATRAADYNVYWGAGGTVDSVIDVTHNVPVPFNADTYRGGWGFLNASDANNTTSYDTRLELTYADLGCVEPFKSLPGAQSLVPCAGTAYTLNNTAIPGPTAFITTSFANATYGAKNAPVAANPGFIMLLNSRIFQFMLDAGGTLPAAGTVWSMRDYIGAAITGGNGFGGDYGPYVFSSANTDPAAPTRTFSAIGAELRANYDVVNQVNTVSNLDLTKIHTVPDPYYVTSAYEVDYTSKVIKFVNLPTQATVRIYSSSGVLVRVLNYESSELGGMLDWNVRNRNNQVVASGVYFYHVESGDARFVGRMTIVNFAK
ncbi:MAG: hypothetical protein R2910_01445 [Gemmatimonadales bacterium]